MLVSVDAAQLEWRVALQLSGDKTGITEILEKQDAHTLNQKAFNLPSRHIAKIYLFRTIFRGTGYSFANDPDFMHVSTSPRFWDDVGEKFYKKYNGLDAWHKQMAEQVVKGELIVSPFGREWLIEIATDFRGEKKIPWTVLSNYPVQGTAADIMTLVRLSFNRRLKDAKLPIKPIQTVHDDVKVDCPPGYEQAAIKLFHDVFRDLPANIKKIFEYDWIVPLACETKMGTNMKDMKEVEPEKT